MKASSDDAGDHEGHVVMLGSAGGEGVGGGHDACNHCHGRLLAATARGGDQGGLAPLVFDRIFGFADAIRVADQNVAGLELDFGLLVAGGSEESDRGAAGFEQDHFLKAQQDGRIVTAVGVDQAASGRIELA